MAKAARRLAKLAGIAAGRATGIEAAEARRRARAALRSALGTPGRGSLAVSEPHPASRPPGGWQAGSGDRRPVDKADVPCQMTMSRTRENRVRSSGTRSRCLPRSMSCLRLGDVRSGVDMYEVSVKHREFWFSRPRRRDLPREREWILS
jgi:hypothetical protein